MANGKPSRVSSPWTWRWRYWRTRFVPVIVWLGAIALAVNLAGRQQRFYMPVVGMVEVREAFVGPAVDGVVAQLEVDLFDRVAQGDVIARMDDRLLVAEIQAARADMARRRAELLAMRELLPWEDGRRLEDQVLALRRHALEQEEARLDVLDRQAELQIARIELEGLAIRLERFEALRATGDIDAVTYEEVLFAHKATEARIREGEHSLDAARELLANATSRRAEMEAAIGRHARQVQDWIAPLEQALAAQENFVAALAAQHELLVLRAPLAGRITSLLAFDGQAVTAGLPVAVVTVEKPERIVAYVEANQLDAVAVGAEVEVATRRLPTRAVRTRISSIGGKMDQVPLQLQRHPMIPQWGLPISIDQLPAEDLYPGEILDIRFIAPERAVQ
jgi:multidrug resistance efflux pump